MNGLSFAPSLSNLYVSLTLKDLKEALKICKSVVLNLMIRVIKQYKDISAPLISQKKKEKHNNSNSVERYRTAD